MLHSPALRTVPFGQETEPRTVPLDLPQTLSRVRSAVDARLPELLERGPSAGLLDDVLDPLPPAAQDALLSPGKRVRPGLVFLAGALFGAKEERLLDPACAVEMVHAASLALDDLPSMDDATTRRGRPALHTVHGEDLAILAGVTLIVRAFGLTPARMARSPPWSVCRAGPPRRAVASSIEGRSSSASEAAWTISTAQAGSRSLSSFAPNSAPARKTRPGLTRFPGERSASRAAGGRGSRTSSRRPAEGPRSSSFGSRASTTHRTRERVSGRSRDTVRGSVSDPDGTAREDWKV